MSDKVKVRLHHTCNAPEHPGGPGDVILVDESLAESWEEKGGGKIVGDEVPLTSDKKPAKTAAKQPAKTGGTAADEK